MSYYGYSFTERNSGGLGALIHDLMLACQYAEQNHFIFAFVKEGYDIPRFNGSIDNDPDLKNEYWHTYFTSFPVVEKKECIETWPCILANTNVEKWDKSSFSELLQNKIFKLCPEMNTKISELVDKTPFNPITDIVLHIRRTDKSTECFHFLSNDIYIRECEYVLNQLTGNNRIYICTDDQSTCFEIKEYFQLKNIEVVWDDTESKLP